MSELILPFIAVSLIHVLGESFRILKIRYITKPLLLPLLAFYYLANAPEPSTLLLLAMAGGWLGDIFLMLPDPEKKRRWFKAGLVAFLIGHILYISVFIDAALGKISFSGPLWVLMAFVFLYGFLVFVKLKPYMGKMAPAITLYIAMIAAMGISTVLCMPGQRLGPALTVIAGALFFMVSDTVNGWNRFAKEVPYERLITMPTYLAGQGLLVAGYLNFVH